MTKLDDILKKEPDKNKPVFDKEQFEKEIEETLQKNKNITLEKPSRPEPVKPVEIPKDSQLDNKDRAKIITQTFDKFKGEKRRLRRQEKKMIKNMEDDSTKSTQNMVIGLAVIALVFLVVAQNIFPGQEMLYVAMILVGSFMFLPIGMIIGWVLLDPVMRCKILRKVSRQNYGVVNMVGKGNKIISKIKNFDYGLIWRQKDCWVLTKDKICQLTKDGNASNTNHMIDPEGVVTLVETVPVIFVDMDSMEPLTISGGGRIPVYPSEIGSTLKGWVDNQRAKMSAGKKTQDILIYIVIIAAIGALVVSFVTMNKVEELYNLLSSRL